MSNVNWIFSGIVIKMAIKNRFYILSKLFIFRYYTNIVYDITITKIYILIGIHLFEDVYAPKTIDRAPFYAEQTSHFKAMRSGRE